MASSVPSEIGPYRVLRPIARGGMAEVYEVEERATGEHQALKLLMQSGGAKARFDREYEAMIRLNHPNIVRVYNYGYLDDLPWLTMELIDGTPIQAYAKRCGRPGTKERTDEVIRVAHDLALALEHIHQRGLLHRDLKSANVLVLPDGRVKLLDFGTAKVTDPVQDITKEGEFIGTFAYASPEQLLSRPVDPRSDLYSFGVLLYRLCTGKMPFKASDLRTLARMQVKKAPKPPRQLVSSLPEALEAVVLRLLSKDPAERMNSGREVANALQEIAGTPLYLRQNLQVDLSTERLVGREEQLSTLWAFLEREAKGEGEEPGAQSADMAMVVGLLGSGRQRVLQALERDISARGWRTVSVFFLRGKEGISQVENGIAGLARSFTPAQAAEVGEELRTLRATDSELSTAERLSELRRAGAAVLAHRAKCDERPLVLLVRNLDHAGAVGFEAVVGLREELRILGAQVLLLGDCTETADDPQSMARKRLPDALRVSLRPMKVREVALSVGSLLHRRPPPFAVARKIWRASGGLPTYVEEVVKHLIDDGLLRVRSRDVNRIDWGERENLEIPVPQGARERVMDALAVLPTDRRRVLEAMAVAGGEGSIHVLAGALQCRAAELTMALEDLANRGWITLRKRRRVPYARWRQILAEKVVVDQLHPCRRHLLERLVVEQVADDPAFVAQVGLLLSVGREEDALTRARDWGAHHLVKHRPATALEALDKVAPLLENAELPWMLRGQVALMHVTCLLAVRPTDPATSKSLARASKLDQPGELFEAELHLARARIQRVIGHLPNFRKHLMEAWYLVEHAEPTPLGSRIAGLLGWSNRVQGHVDDAASWHGRARRIAVQVGIPAVRAHADVGVGAWQVARGLIAEGERTVVAAIAVFDQVGDMEGQSEALPVWAHCLRQQGRFSEALGVLNQQLPQMRDAEVPSFYVRMLLATAWCEIDLGRLGRAQENVDELGATLRKGEHLDLRLYADLLWGRINLASGLFEDALHRLDQVESRARSAGLGVISHTALALAAEARWNLGDEGRARRDFDRAVQHLKHSGDVPATAAACIAQSRAMCEVMPADELFKPVAEWMDSQPAVVARIERQVASARFFAAHGQEEQAAGAYEQAEAMVDQLSQGLDATDAAALRLSEWTQHIRRSRRPSTS